MSNAIPKATPEEVAALKARRVARQNRLRLEDQRKTYERTLVTPEGAEIRLTLSTAALRLAAFIIDFMVFIVLMILVQIFAISNSSNGWFSRDDTELLTEALLYVIWFLLRNFYWVVFEAGRWAATPGKRIVGLRVVARDGGHLSLGAILARNFSREIEVFLPMAVAITVLASSQGLNLLINLMLFLWVSCFLFFPVFNRDKLRLGDLIAGTYVIRTPKTKLLDDISQSKQPEGSVPATIETGPRFTKEQLDVYGIHELQVLESVLRRKEGSALPKVAQKIRQKIGYQGQMDDRAFLEVYYKALRQHLEQALLLGKRKEDKFDR